MDIPIVGVVGLVTLVWKFIDFLRMLTNFSASKSGIATQALSWVGGIVAVLLYASSNFANTVTIGGLSLDKVSVVTLVLIGVVLGSMASASVDIKQALDSNDSAVKPSLLKE